MGCVFLTPPEDFHSRVEVAGCYCEYEDKILLLKRTPHKLHGTTWNIPGGKLDEGEAPRAAAARELFEEAGIDVPQDDLEAVSKFYIRGVQMDYIFYTFRVRFPTVPSINLGLEEHVEARWVTIEEALKLPLIYGGVEALLDYQKYR